MPRQIAMTSARIPPPRGPGPKEGRRRTDARGHTVRGRRREGVCDEEEGGGTCLGRRSAGGAAAGPATEEEIEEGRGAPHQMTTPGRDRGREGGSTPIEGIEGWSSTTDTRRGSKQHAPFHVSPRHHHVATVPRSDGGGTRPNEREGSRTDCDPVSARSLRSVPTAERDPDCGAATPRGATLDARRCCVDAS